MYVGSSFLEKAIESSNKQGTQKAKAVYNL